MKISIFKQLIKEMERKNDKIKDLKEKLNNNLIKK